MKLRKVSDGPFAYEPGMKATYQGKSIGRGHLLNALFGACLSAGGEVVRWEHLVSITDASVDPRNVLQVTVFRIRRNLRALGAPSGVIQTVAGHGLRWDRTAMEREAA